MTADDVKQLQRLLVTLGHTVEVDGLWGPKTAAALALATTANVSSADDDDAAIISHLREEEGEKLYAYKDHLGYWTIGIGRLIDSRKGGGITTSESEYLLRNSLKDVQRGLDAKWPWWRKLAPARRVAMQSMAYQMGLNGLATFRSSLAAAQEGRWSEMARNLRASEWARQTPQRARRVIALWETGVFA